MGMKKRFVALGVIFCLLLATLTVRLATIQLLEGSPYSKMAAEQSMALLNGFTQRGGIYDRNGVPLTNRENGLLLFVEDRKIDEYANSQLLRIGANAIDSLDEKYVVYQISQIPENVLEILSTSYGALAIKSEARYQKNQPAVHVIGYVNKEEQTGACGIEKDYETVLSGGEQAVYGQMDGQGYFIPGYSVLTQGAPERWGVITTLDLSLQFAAEAILREAEVSGAILVVDVESGEVLASASSPTYNPERVEDYLDSPDQVFLNQVTQCQYPPGSVFKIVVAAAALEAGIVTPESRFDCDGVYEFLGQKIQCSTGGDSGHGSLTLSEAFAKSCNSTFIQLGQKVGAEGVLKMARAFGLEETAIRDCSEQLVGNLPSSDATKGAGIGNLSIGQGELLMTPAQVAKMTRIIASGGTDSPLLLVKGTMEGTRGNILAPRGEQRRVISVETAEQVRKMMETAVTSGTADNLVLPPGITAAGKTGSAEATIEQEHLVHSWFTGFVPAMAPQIVITVFVEKGGSGRTAAVPLFQRMVEDWNNLNR